MKKNSIALVFLCLLWGCVSDHVEPSKTGPSGRGGPYAPAGKFVIDAMLIGNRIVPESMQNCAKDDTFTIAKKVDGRYYVQIDLGVQDCGGSAFTNFLLNESNVPNSGFNFALPPSYRITRFSGHKYGDNFYEINADGNELTFTITPQDPLSSVYVYKLRRIEE